jgi:hypothetical protein
MERKGRSNNKYEGIKKVCKKSIFESKIDQLLKGKDERV